MIGPQGPVGFRALEADIRRAVHLLADVNVQPGQSVSIAVSDIYLEWVLILALARLGIASAPPADVDSEFRITAGATAAGTAEGAAQVIALSQDQVDTILQGPERPHLRRVPEPESLGRVIRTSGTTGDPKRVGLSWRSITANSQNLAFTHGRMEGCWLVTTGVATPLGFITTIGAMICGYPGAIAAGPHPSSILHLKPSLLGIVPTQIQYLLEAMPADHPKWPLRIMTSGAGIPPEMARQIRNRLTDDVLGIYGLSETLGVAAADLDLIENVPGAAGYMTPNVELRLLDQDGEEVPLGEAGRVVLRSTQIASGYLGEPEETASAFRDGWFHTSDLGRLREDGLLMLEGRADDLMNLGGQKVLPAVIENPSRECQGVLDVGAFSFQTELGIDRCGIAVVTDDSFEMDAFIREISQKLPWLRRMQIMQLNALPRNAMGKVERLRLRTLLHEALARGEGIPDDPA